MLLATQNISAAIDPEILQNSTYRICLKVSDPQDSIQMVGIPDAISLKRGRAYFSVSSRVLYQSAFAGADYDPDNIGSFMPNSIIRIQPDGQRDVIKMMVYGQPGENQTTQHPATEAVAVVDYLAETAKRIGLQSPPSIWQDALPIRAYLQDVLDHNLTGGWDGNTWQQCHELINRNKVIKTVYPYLGIYDRPQDQSQPNYQIDPLQGGHILIFGSAGSGKSTLLRTFVTSLCLTHTPEQANIYILDYGGQSRLKILESFPQVGAVITRLETERTERLISYLSSEILRRTNLMRKAKVDSWVDYNTQIKSAESLPAIFLIIDNFLNLKDTFEPEVIKKIVMLLSGQSAGIHLAVSSYIQSDMPNELLSNINARISLYQATPDEYHGLVGFPSEARLQEDAMLGMRPGRGLLRSTSPLSIQALLPTYGNNDKELTDNLTALTSAMEDAWQGKPTPPEIQVLEEFIYIPQVQRESGKFDYFSETGITYQDLKPIGFSLGRDSSAFLVSSTAPGEGKTTYLQMWLLNLAEKYPSSQLEIKILGYHSQSLLPLKSLPHTYYVKVKTAFQDWLNETSKTIEKRKKDQEKQIRANADDFDQEVFLSKYSHIFVVVDDYGKFSSSLSDNERTQLNEIIQNGDETGISIVIADTMADLPKVYQDSLMSKFSTSGCGVLLGGSDGIDLFNNARIASGQPNSNLQIGRGYIIKRGKVKLFQSGVWWQQYDNPAECFQKRLERISK
ncbi:MAG: hypothetical protein C0410_13035 [Anaerolinea sp.]|nr:hypothetical protein [Anaerolinea sp.]